MVEPTVSAREPLNRDRILAAALAIIDAEGLPALSMRRLGAALGVEAMAIYHHFPNTDALLDASVDVLLSPRSEMPQALEWRDGLHWGADTLRATWREHPGAIPLVTSSELRTESAGRWIGDPIALLTDAGFAPDDALALMRAVLALLFGWITFEGAKLRSHDTQRDAPADLASARPAATMLRSQMNDWSAGFDETLDVLLDSWARRLPPGSRGASRAAAAPARPVSGSAWIVEKGGDATKARKKDKGGKKKGKGKKKV